MKKSNIIALILALIAGLWMGIGIQNVAAGAVTFVAVFLVAKLFLWGLGVDHPKKVAFRTATIEINGGQVRGSADLEFRDREQLETFVGHDCGLALSAAFAVGSVWIGLTLSYLFPTLPPSTMVISTAAAIYVATLAQRKGTKTGPGTLR